MNTLYTIRLLSTGLFLLENKTHGTWGFYHKDGSFHSGDTKSDVLNLGEIGFSSCQREQAEVNHTVTIYEDKQIKETKKFSFSLNL
jgi:hypothetical protein